MVDQPFDDQNAGDANKTLVGPAEHSSPAAWAVCGLLVLAVGLVFGQTIGFEFVNFDDDDYIYENPQVVGGLSWQGLRWAFTQSHSGNWHPLTWLSHMLDYQCFGDWAGGHHLVNILLHAATAVVLYVALRRMTDRLWPSALVAAVFAVHPLRAESVAWVSERKDLLSGLLFTLTLVAYAGYVRRGPSPSRYLVVLTLFALGLMAKPMLVTLPMVLLLLDYWPLRRFDGDWRRAMRVIAEKIPLLLLSAASCTVTLLVQRAAFAQSEAAPIHTRIANALLAYVIYLGQVFRPVGLAVLYPYPPQGYPKWEVVGAAVLLISLTALAVACWRTRPYLLAGWLWYLGTLVPVIGLIQVGAQARADRYTYLAQVGVYLSLVWLGESLCRSWLRRRICAAVAALVVGVLGVRGWQQTFCWHDSEALWRQTLAHTSRNYLAHNNFGADLSGRNRLDEAILQYRSAVEIKPDYAEANFNLANLLSKQGKDKEAAVYYERALQCTPDRVEIHFMLGTVLRQQGRIAEAVACFERALQAKPDYVEAHVNLGSALRQLGRIDDAIAHYEAALQLKPDHGEAYNNLGNAMLAKGRPDEALAHYEKALAVNPKNAEAHYNLANVLLSKGRFDQAVSHFQAALDLNPGYADAHQNLGVARFQQRDVSGAVAHWRAALGLRPDNAALLNQTAWALALCPDASVRNGKEAIELARRAARLTEGRDPAILDTLAAAYAEAGRFPDALETAQRALDLAVAQGNSVLAGTLRARLQLYRARRPAWSVP